MALAKTMEENLYLIQLLNRMDSLQEYAPVKILSAKWAIEFYKRSSISTEV